MGTKKINRLTEQQVSQFAIYRDKWLNIGLNTEPTDIPAAEAAVKQCYELAGLIMPQSIICVDSPSSAVDIVNKRTSVLGQVRNKVRDHVYHHVKNHVYNHVRKHVCNHVWNQVYNQVWKQVYDQVWHQVWNQVSHNTEHYSQCYGYHDAGLLSFYDYFREVCGLAEETEKITGLIALAKCCGWWTPYENVVIIQHRPCFLNFDDEKRIHCDDGMAIKYRDGFGVWSIHGFRVDEQIVMKPHEQTIKQIRDEENVEKKRIRIERFGWDRYLTGIGAKVIDRRHNSIENTEETLVKTPDGMIILLPTCKTGRLFSLEVPSKISSCEQAQNWLHSGSQLDIIAGKTRVVGRS